MYLQVKGDLAGTFTNNNTSVHVITSGCIVLGSVGAAVASFAMHTSGASECGVHLIAYQENVWTIVSEFLGDDGITEM